jgi:hypothetical protein
MKMRTIALSVLVTFFAFTSCKKDSKPSPAPNNDPELLGPQTDKVAHYNFNGSLNDGSGNNLNASISNNSVTYTTDRFGRANQALSLSAGATAWITTPSLSTRVTGFPFAISLWFKATGVTNSQTLIRTDGGESSYYVGAWLQLAVGGQGTMSLSFGDNTGTSGSSRNTITTSAVITPNTWHHVVINVRGANDMDFYINGAKNNEATYSGSATNMVYHPTYTGGAIGVYPGASSNFDGLMDDYRIYNKVLSQTEVSTLYNFRP